MRKLAAILVLAGGAVTAQASVIFADGFNFNPGPAPGSFMTVSSGTFGPWTVGGAGVDRIGGYWQTAEGNGSVDMSALNNGTLTASLNTVAGQSYVLSFYLAGNTDSGPTVKQLGVQAGNLNQTFSFDTTGHSHGSMGWALQSAPFTAQGSVTALTFTSMSNNPYGPAVDGVMVETVDTAAPEPASYAFALLGLAGIGLLRLRQRA